MIAADTSSMVAYLGAASGRDVDLVAQALHSDELSLPPAVIAELLSDPASADVLGEFLPSVRLLDLSTGFWHRAGQTRCLLKRKGLKARLGDALIAQSCLDHDVALITRDGDFRHFAKHCGLKLA